MKSVQRPIASVVALLVLATCHTPGSIYAIRQPDFGNSPYRMSVVLSATMLASSALLLLVPFRVAWAFGLAGCGLFFLSHLLGAAEGAFTHPVSVVGISLMLCSAVAYTLSRPPTRAAIGIPLCTKTSWLTVASVSAGILGLLVAGTGIVGGYL